jgi:hypothetical protein
MVKEREFLDDNDYELMGYILCMQAMHIYIYIYIYIRLVAFSILEVFSPFFFLALALFFSHSISKLIHFQEIERNTTKYNNPLSVGVCVYVNVNVYVCVCVCV